MSTPRISLGSTRLRLMLLLFVLLAAALAMSLLPAVTPPANAVATKAAHPYSHPMYSPMRAESTIGCVNRNCPTYVNGDGWHNYWAIDFYDPEHEPGDLVYATGAGQVFIGGRVAPEADATGCLPIGSKGTPGNWLWIDHGGGIVSRYHHLDSIKIANGSWVTPSTVIGTRGHSGNVKQPGGADAPAQCGGVEYLHYEVRQNGWAGEDIYPGNLFACVGAETQMFPRDLTRVGDWDNWDDVDAHKTLTPVGNNTCIPELPATAHPPSYTGMRVGDNMATISWPKPDDSSPAIGAVVVSLERWMPSLGKYDRPVFRQFSNTGTAGQTTFTGLQNGFKYRSQVAYRNAAGYSDWGGYRYGTPAGVPTAPAYRSPGISSTRSTVRLYWTASKGDGTPVTGYRVSLRHYIRGTWTRWVESPAGMTYSYMWDGLPSRRTVQAKVRATSAAGPSPYSRTYQVTTTS